MKIVEELRWLKRYLVSFIQSLTTKKKVFIIGTPLHGNIGDQAIALAERKFLNEYGEGIKVIEIPTPFLVMRTKPYKWVVRKSKICIHGGGFLGSLWKNEEEMFRCVLKYFPDNQIVVFPQTVYFDKESEQDGYRQESVNLYNSHKHLKIFVREKGSFEYMKKHFPKVKTSLVPDMVLFMDNIKTDNHDNLILTCFRNDKERVLTTEEQERIESILLHKYSDCTINRVDTMIEGFVNEKQRKNSVYQKIMEFAKAKLIITDRLHGMVFSMLAGTPCIVTSNCNYKVRGVYEWIKDCGYVIYTDDVSEVEEILDGQIEKNEGWSTNVLRPQYEELKKAIFE